MATDHLMMTKEVIRAQIDVCGQSVSYVAANASGAVSDEVMWALNQATIALQEAYKKLGVKELEAEGGRISMHDIFPAGALAVLGALEGKSVEEMAQSILDEEDKLASKSNKREEE